MGSGQITKNRINLDLIRDISILFEDLYICGDTQTYEQMYECMGGLMGRLM